MQQQDTCSQAVDIYAVKDKATYLLYLPMRKTRAGSGIVSIHTASGLVWVALLVSSVANLFKPVRTMQKLVLLPCAGVLAKEQLTRLRSYNMPAIACSRWKSMPPHLLQPGFALLQELRSPSILLEKLQDDPIAPAKPCLHLVLSLTTRLTGHLRIHLLKLRDRNRLLRSAQVLQALILDSQRHSIT